MGQKIPLSLLKKTCEVILWVKKMCGNILISKCVNKGVAYNCFQENIGISSGIRTIKTTVFDHPYILSHAHQTNGIIAYQIITWYNYTNY